MSEILQCAAGILISIGLLVNCYLLHLQDKRLDIIEKELKQYAKDDKN